MGGGSRGGGWVVWDPGTPPSPGGAELSKGALAGLNEGPEARRPGLAITSAAPSRRAAEHPQGSPGQQPPSARELDGLLPQVHNTLHTARV